MEIENLAQGDYIRLTGNELGFYQMHCDECPTGIHGTQYSERVEQYFEQFYMENTGLSLEETAERTMENVRREIGMRKSLEDSLSENSKGLLNEMRLKEVEKLDQARPMDDRGNGDPRYQQVNVLMVRGYAVLLE